MKGLVEVSCITEPIRNICRKIKRSKEGRKESITKDDSNAIFTLELMRKDLCASL